MMTRRIASLQSSPTLSLDATVKELQASGIAIVHLGGGEPDFSTSEHIRHAAIEAINQGFTHYTATAGILELRKAIAVKLQKENSITYDPSEIVVGVGSKQLLYHALQVLCEEGDEVLIATPTWSTYIEQVKLAGATPIVMPLAPPFRLTAADIEKYISSRTKCILLNSPANPTGAVLDRQELERIATLAVAKKFFIISDEIYEKIVYGVTHCSIASLSDAVKQRTVTVNGFSKAYAMTGWRIGYAAGPRDVIDGMIALQSQTTSNTSSIAQKAALAALQGSEEPLTAMVQEFAKRRAVLLEGLLTIPGVSSVVPEGAFYCFVSIEKLLSASYPTATMWAAALLSREHVAVVPGEAFLAPGYIRVSFTAAPSVLEEGLQRIKHFVSSSDR